MKLSPFFTTLFLGANSQFYYNQKAAVQPGQSFQSTDSDVQYVIVICKNSWAGTSDYPIYNRKFQIKVFWDPMNAPTNDWQSQTFKGDCMGRGNYMFEIAPGKTAGWIWVRGDGQENSETNAQAEIEVRTNGRCLYNDCFNGNWQIDGMDNLFVTSESTANDRGRCIGDVGVDGNGWCELTRKEPGVATPTVSPRVEMPKTVCGHYSDFQININHDLYYFQQGSHGWSDFSSFYWSKVPDYMTSSPSYGFTLKHELDVGTQITIRYPKNLSFNLYVIYEAEAANEGWTPRGGGFDMGYPKEFGFEKLQMNHWPYPWTNMGTDEVSFYSTYFGSTRRMGLWTKKIRGSHDQNSFSLPAFTQKFTGGIVVQPLDNLYYCGKK